MIQITNGENVKSDVKRTNANKNLNGNIDLFVRNHEHITTFVKWTYNELWTLPLSRAALWPRQDIHEDNSCRSYKTDVNNVCSSMHS